jgi:hypothetical protein
LDLGKAYQIESVRLHAIRYGAVEGMGFPLRFKVELWDRSDPCDKLAIADFTERDYPNIWARTITLSPDRPVKARFVRLTATRLRVIDAKACLAFSQIEVICGGKNVAAGADVTASDSLEQGHWSCQAVTDGKLITGSDPLANSTLLVRREFTIRPGFARAIAHVCGLGHYHLVVNGRQVDQAFLTPGWTTYEKTCLYDTYDLTGYLNTGANAIGLILAGGMYNCQGGRYVKFIGPFRPLTAKAVLELVYQDGSKEYIVTDDTWQVHDGHIMFCNVYGGEDYDARLYQAGWDRPGFDASGWQYAAVWSGPGGRLRGRECAPPALRGQEVLRPVSARSIRPGLDVYDMGQNASIAIRMKVSGQPGGQVKVTPAELVRADGTVDRGSCGGGQAYWLYTLAGQPSPEQYEAIFFYHGARYLQVETIAAPGSYRLPQLQSIEAVVVHSDCRPIGQFECSSDLLNRIRLLVRWAQRSNLASVLTDCPHRERLGWLEQYHLNGPSLRYEWDITQLYRKCLQDMADAQQPDGLVPDIAPEYVVFDGGFRDSPEWGSAVILATWQHLIWSADDKVLWDYWPVMQRYLRHLHSKASDHILTYGLGDWYDRGPNRPGFSQLTPMGITATAIYYQDLQMMAQMARLLGRQEDVAGYLDLAGQVRDAFNKRFYDPNAGIYGTGSQTSLAMPLVIGLAKPEARDGLLDSLFRDIHQKGFTAGDVGYRYVLRALADAGRSDLIFRIIQDANRPGYTYQLAKGATSLTEAWDADRRSSQNHFMLGQVIEWLYHDLAGIRPAAAGFKQVLFEPHIIDGLSWVRASHESPYGLIQSAWSRRPDGTIQVQLAIPVNTSGHLRLRIADPRKVMESGLPVDQQVGIRLASYSDGIAVYELDSGSYDLVIAR